MDKLEYALAKIKACQNCRGLGNIYYGDGEDYFDYEVCECNSEFELIIDEDGDVIWDNGLLTMENEENKWANISA